MTANIFPQTDEETGTRGLSAVYQLFYKWALEAQAEAVRAEHQAAGGEETEEEPEA